jgi:hypothetical protein
MEDFGLTEDIGILIAWRILAPSVQFLKDFAFCISAMSGDA